MLERAQGIRTGHRTERVWFLEHPPLYTMGRSAKEKDILSSAKFPVFKTGRGGQVTYHGPGQRIAYVQLDLNHHNRDLRAYVYNLEEWLIQTLDHFGIKGERRQGRVGIWVEHNGREEKIGAIGVRVQKWVTLHGMALNVNPDLSHFDHIIPCGLQQYGVTSFEKLGIKVSMEDVDTILQKTFSTIFNSDL